MTKKANPKLIGIFVLVAVALLVAGIVIFGSGRFFQEKQRFVLFFEGSIKGLDIGAPVILKGVRIGSVTDVKVVYDPELWAFQSPVYIELFPDKIADLDVQEEVRQLYEYERGSQEMIDLFVQRGLRGQLELQSFLTGRLMVALDFHPGTPAYLVGADMKHPEIPTIPSQMAQLTKTLQNLRLDELVESATNAVKSADRLLSKPELDEAVVNLNLALAAAKKLAEDLDREVEPLSTSAQATLKDARKALRTADGQLTQLGGAATETFTTLNKEVIGDRAALRYQLLATLTDLRDAALAIRQLAETLNEQPDALIRGKRDLPEGK